MEDHRLKAFCLVFELKSFSKAAEAKLMSQSAMSHLIKNLEEELGVRLFTRKGENSAPDINRKAVLWARLQNSRTIQKNGQ